MSLTCHEEIGRVGRVGQGCYEDATRKLLTWNISCLNVRPLVHLSVINTVKLITVPSTANQCRTITLLWGH